MTNKRIISMVLALCMIFSAFWAIMGVSFAATPKYKMGDVDNSGGIEAADARLALRASVGLEQYKKTDREYICADVDGSGVIEAGDARLILRGSVGLENPAAWTVPAYADTGEAETNVPKPTIEKPEPTTEYEPVVRAVEQPACKKGEKVVKDKDGTHTYDQYTFTFKTIPHNLEELQQIDLSDRTTGGCLATCLAILVYDAYVPQDGEMFGDKTSNRTLNDVYEMLKYLCEYNPDSTASTTYHNKLFANDTKTTVHDQLYYNNKYIYTINSYKNGATIRNGYTPSVPISITVTDYNETLSAVKGYPERHRFYFSSAGADGERYIDMFYSTKNNRWYVYGETWKYLLMGVKDPIVQWIRPVDSSVPAGRKMEQPTYTKGEKVIKDMEFIDGETGEKKKETVHLAQYTFTFKTLPQTLGELMQFDLSDPEIGGYLLTALSLLIYDNYVPANGELTSTPSKNATLEEAYKMVKYLSEYDPGSSASTNYHNRLDPNPSKQFIHDRLAYNDKFRYTFNSYKNGATPENEYTPTLPVSITVTEYAYELAQGGEGYPTVKRFTFQSSGADSDRFLDAFYDAPNQSWFIYGNTWRFPLEAVRDPVPTEF